jgi:ACR3 family arsenite efflux pump ArsB
MSDIDRRLKKLEDDRSWIGLALFGYFIVGPVLMLTIAGIWALFH